MENNEIINVQMTKEVFETLGSGGSDTPTTTITVDGEVTIGTAQVAAEWDISISEEIRNEINSSTMPILIKGVITNEQLGILNYELNILRKISMSPGEMMTTNYIGSFIIQTDSQLSTLAAIVVTDVSEKLQIIARG